jgi:GTPase SAR1 family protein
MFGLLTGLYNLYFTPESISVLLVGCDGVGKTALLERCKVTKFTERRFAPSSATCRSGKFGSSSVRGIHRLKQPSHQRRNSSLPEALNMDKIRPTVGQNIAKIDLFGTKALLWDLGGQTQMRPLWERYYNDCDGLIFVVESSMFYFKVEDQSNSQGLSSTSSPSSDLFEKRLNETKRELSKILQEESLRGVPIMIFVNKLDEVLTQHQKYVQSEEEEFDQFWEDELYECVMQRLELSTLLSCSSRCDDVRKSKLMNGDVAYDNHIAEETSPNRRIIFSSQVEVFAGSAKTGQGVKVAMEWLLNAARAQSRKSRQVLF